MRIENAIHGQRIVIRNYEVSDLDFVTGMWLDEVNGQYMSDPTAEYVDDAFRNALDTLSDSPFVYYLVIELTSTGDRIGSFSIFPDEDAGVYDIGYCIHRDHWKRGYGSESLALMLDWMKERGVQTVTAEVAVDNAPSNALLRKFGFAVQKNAAFQKYHMDIRFDSYIYARTL